MIFTHHHYFDVIKTKQDKRSIIFTCFKNKPGYPHCSFHGITLVNHHCSPQMESMSLTTKDQGLSQVQEDATGDEH